MVPAETWFHFVFERIGWMNVVLEDTQWDIGDDSGSNDKEIL